MGGGQCVTLESLPGRWLRDNRHLRYMWIPYTDTVVVVQCNPAAGKQQAAYPGSPSSDSSLPNEQRLKALTGVQILRSLPITHLLFTLLLFTCQY